MKMFLIQECVMISWKRWHNRATFKEKPRLYAICQDCSRFTKQTIKTIYKNQSSSFSLFFCFLHIFATPVDSKNFKLDTCNIFCVFSSVFTHFLTKKSTGCLILSLISASLIYTSKPLYSLNGSKKFDILFRMWYIFSVQLNCFYIQTDFKHGIHTHSAHFHKCLHVS